MSHKKKSEYTLEGQELSWTQVHHLVRRGVQMAVRVQFLMPFEPLPAPKFTAHTQGKVLGILCTIYSHTVPKDGESYLEQYQNVREMLGLLTP